jgi:hypothetical protein
MQQNLGPLPDCAFIQTNKPTGRPIPLTTSSKLGKTKMKKSGKSKAGVAKKSAPANNTNTE